jgi:hypothetical protein
VFGEHVLGRTQHAVEVRLGVCAQSTAVWGEIRSVAAAAAVSIDETYE